MADTPEVQEEVKEEVIETFEEAVLGAGPVVRSNMVLLTQAYATTNRSQLLAQRRFRENLKKTLAEYDEIDNKLFDKCQLGYMDTGWLNGIERLRKLREDAPKPPAEDPADNC
jgi:hypothetical protein